MRPVVLPANKRVRVGSNRRNRDQHKPQTQNIPRVVYRRLRVLEPGNARRFGSSNARVLLQAGISFGIYGACAFAAKLAWGFLADRYSIWLLAIIALIGSAISIFAGVSSTNVWQFYGTSGVMYGLTGGSLVVIGPLLWAAHFGRRHQGAIRGVLSPFYLIASIGGPLFAALVYDHFGSYDVAFRVFAGYFVASAALVWLAGRWGNQRPRTDP